MQKQLSLFTWAAAVFGMAAVVTSTDSMASVVINNNIGSTGTGFHGANTVDLTSPPARPEPVVAQPAAPVNVVMHKYDTRSSGFRVNDCKNMYYSAKYDEFCGCDAGCGKPVAAPVPIMAPPPQRVVAQPAPPPAAKPAPAPKRTETVRKEAARKYHLAHPFFQPAQGRIGGLTDIGWHRNTYDFKLVDVHPSIIQSADGFYEGLGGDWKATQLFIKQDLSFGITDDIAIIGSVKYGWNNYEMNWSSPLIPNDKNKKNGFDQYGIGAQWKFYEDSDWISYIAGYYQWNDIASTLLADYKLGYKISDTTIYGIARLWYVMWDDNSYGNGITDDAGNTTYFAFKRNVDNSVYAEGGLGVFSALDRDWSVSAELVFGNYDWHSQLSISAGINWQPGDHFAIGLYGRASVWDSANGSEKAEVWAWTPSIPPTYVSQLHMSSYQDLTLGAKVYFYF
ncbi:MAG: hypothetical protein FWF34_00805 [Alphaproteobacteria bacterium]|nr:hypothetical protein [Alphaproteobacteria bacterium]MCL2889785.1 hypothetical protein [Alphaproteobacteria bacterium]